MVSLELDNDWLLLKVQQVVLHHELLRTPFPLYQAVVADADYVWLHLPLPRVDVSLCN